MKPTVADLLCALDTFAPERLAEPWDNVGLLVGKPADPVNGVLVGLDPTLTLVEEAVARGMDTIITHHPVIFKPLSAINTDDPIGRLLQMALSHNITIIGCHTNLDSAAGGVNDALAQLLGLEALEPLLPGTEDGGTTGLGRIGRYPSPLSAGEFTARVFDALDLDTFAIAGSLPENIACVALCGGSGSDLAPTARSRGADVYLTAEIKHAMAVWAVESGFAVIDGTHYATEKPGTLALAAMLSGRADSEGWETSIQLTETEGPALASVYRNISYKVNHKE